MKTLKWTIFYFLILSIDLNAQKEVVPSMNNVVYLNEPSLVDRFNSKIRADARIKNKILNIRCGVETNNTTVVYVINGKVIDPKYDLEPVGSEYKFHGVKTVPTGITFGGELHDVILYSLEIEKYILTRKTKMVYTDQYLKEVIKPLRKLLKSKIGN